jgi:hypothetical protein
MLFSRGHAVGSIHWAQLAKHETEAAERELAEARAAIARAKVSAKADSEAHAEDLPPLRPEEFIPDPVVPQPFDTHIKVEVDGVDQELGQVGTRPDDAHSGEVIEPKPFPEIPKRGPGRPRKDGH